MNIGSLMNRRSFLSILSQRALAVAALFYLWKTPTKPALGGGLKSPLSRKNPHQILMEIYNEVIKPERFVNKNYIKKEFFIDLDSHATNKEEHVVVLNMRQRDSEEMLIQITYFEPKKENRFIKLAKKTKKITCYLRGGEIKIAQCDYTEKEMRNLLSRILDGIRNKKRLLELIKY